MIVVIIAEPNETGCTIVLEAWQGTGTPAASYPMTEVSPTVYESANITGLTGEFRVRMRNAASQPVYTGYVSFHAGTRGQADDQPVSLAPDPITPIPETETDEPETVASQMDAPSSITIDGVTVQNRSIPDMIAGERHAAANAAAAKGAPFGLGFGKIRPGSGRGS